MNMALRIVNALRNGNSKPPSPGRMFEPRAEDQWRSYPGDGLTPSRMAAILKRADAGDLDEAMQLYEQMEEKDAHLFSVANTRRLALTGLDWDIIASRERVGDDGIAVADALNAADAAAAFCREALLRTEKFDAALQHLSLAIGRNIAVAELVWGESKGELRLRSIEPVDFVRLVFDEGGALRILTEEEPMDGIGLMPNKFAVHTPHSASGHPSRGGLLRATALSFLAKQFAVKDWIVFAEVFGMPVRIGKYDPKATPAEKRELMDMLRNIGSEAAGVFSKSMSLEFLEANRGTAPPPYETMATFFNREISKAWLGQTLTTDASGSPGSFSVAKIHEQVRQDIREDDIRKEAVMVRRDILRPLTRFKFGAGVPVPIFRRKLRGPMEATDLAKMLSVAVNDLGMDVPSEWAHEALSVPSDGGGGGALKGRGRDT